MVSHVLEEVFLDAKRHHKLTALTVRGSNGSTTS